MTAVLSPDTDDKLPPPVSAFQGIVGREPYPVTDKAGEIVRRLLQFGVTRLSGPVQGEPEPLRGGGHFPGSAGAVQERAGSGLAGTEADCTVTCTQAEGETPAEFTADSY